MRGRPRVGVLPLLLGVWCVLCASCSQDDASGRGADNPGRGRGSRPTEGSMFLDQFQYIRIEAEDATKIESDDAHPGVGGKLMRIVDDPDASGGKCILIPDKAGTPFGKAGDKDDIPRHARAVYKIKIPVTGNYTFWCRRKWYDSCGDTLYVRFDKEGAPDTDTQAHVCGADDSSKPPRWNWSPVKEKGNLRERQFYLAAGEHTLEILAREDGPRFDVILLTDDPDHVPQGMGE